MISSAEGSSRTRRPESALDSTVRFLRSEAAVHKTVADCFRYRRHVGLEVALAALRGYLGRPVARGGTRRTGSPIDDLVAAARADRISAVLRPYLEALA